MKYLDFKNWMKGFTVFSLDDIRLIEKDFHRRRLSEWRSRGYIEKIIDGYYIFSDLEITEKVLFEIANRIYAPSYVSLEMALQWYNVIPETVHSITSVTARKTNSFETETGSFSYRTVKSEFFFGYKIVHYDRGTYKLARLEKCILDYLYLNPDIEKPEDFEYLRFDRSILNEGVDIKKLDSCNLRFNKKALTRRVDSLKEYMK